MEGSGSPQWGLVDRAEGRYDDRNQDSQRQPPMRSSASQPPGYGLLSRTLIHSPVVKKILPARVRRPDLNDVVFIGENFIELHILTESGKLQKVGCKTDFRGQIRDACVFGSQRESRFEAASNAEVKLASPADLLVLTMDSGHLAFIYARDSQEQGQVDFKVSTKHLDSRGVKPSNLGRIVAVDPQSRAMAVAAYTDYFRIFALHPMEELHRQMLEGLPLNPIREERTFEVKGAFIVHMEFLYPSTPDDRDHVILVLFLVDPEKKFRLQLYEWNTTKSLQTTLKQGRDGLRLSEDISFPLHLIPLVIRSAFLIVTEFYTYVVKTSDILSGNAVFAKIPFPEPDGQNQSLVTAWSRPYRHPDYSGTHDDMYVAMENGDIYFLEVDAHSHQLVQTATKASYFDCSIGTAFAVLDYGLKKNDMIVAGGEMSSGGIYLLQIAPFPDDSRAILEESVSNWAPVFDFELVNMSAWGHGSGTAERDRVFACTGRGDHGAITELRYGIQASTHEPVDYLQGVRRLFILPDASSRGYFVLSSLADQSFLCYRSAGRDGEWFECEGALSLEFEEATLAAGPLELGVDEPALWSVQVTPSAITVAQLSEEYTLPKQEPDSMGDGEGRRRLQRRCDGGDTIIAAAIHGKFVLIALRNGFAITLILAVISIKPDSDGFLEPIGTPVSLKDDPTFVGFVELQGRFMVLVGTRHSTVQIYLCENSDGLVPIKEQSMYEDAMATQHGLTFCESAVMLSTDSAAKLLCGLRDGTMIVFDVVTTETTIELSKCQDIKFGPIPVLLYLDVRRKDSAFALAGPEVYRFDMPRDNFRAAQLVFVVKESDIDPELEAIVQVKYSHERENTFVCVTKDKLLCADVGQSEKICGRRLNLHETPRRLLFYEPMGVFIVACALTTKNRSSGCTLKIIDPKSGESRLSTEEARDHKSNEVIFDKRNEQIFCLAEWSMELNGNLYRYIVVGAGNMGPRRKGRVVVMSLTKNQVDGRIEIRKRFQVICDEPVFSLAPYGSDSLLYCSGKKLFIKRFNLESKKLDLIAETPLRSPAIQITVKEPLIYLSTSEDSVLVLHYIDNTLTESFSDEISRNGFHHTNLLPDLILATDKQYGVIGLWKPPLQRTLTSLHTVFEAELASSISRIRRGTCRPPWVPPGRCIPGVVDGAKNILAAGVDGSFFQLMVLDAGALKLLGRLSGVRGTAGYVDGDLLGGVVERGAGWLRAKFGGEEEEFTALAREVLGLEDGHDVFEEVLSWVDALLNDAVL